MNRISGILILIMIYIACSSRTCTEESNMKTANELNGMTASLDSIRKAFEVDQPDDDLLKAYEETAIQKLSDFADYLKIVSDTSLNIKFRQQGAEMAKRLFVTGDIKIHNQGYAGSENDIPNLKELLEKVLSEGSACWIRPEEIKVAEPLTARNDSTYSGKLSFFQKCIPYNAQESTTTISPRMVSIDIHVIRKVKSFGDKSLTMWEVNLGNLN